MITIRKIFELPGTSLIIARSDDKNRKWRRKKVYAMGEHGKLVKLKEEKIGVGQYRYNGYRFDGREITTAALTNQVIWNPEIIEQ